MASNSGLICGEDSEGVVVFGRELLTGLGEKENAQEEVVRTLRLGSPIDEGSCSKHGFMMRPIFVRRTKSPYTKQTNYLQNHSVFKTASL